MEKKLVSSSYHLYGLLEKKYGERFSANPIDALMGNIKGTIDSKRIKITFDGKQFLLISTAPSTRDILDELLPILKEVMGDAEPICSYDLQSAGLTEEEAMPTIEWDVLEPEERLKEIVNGRAFSDHAKILNLKICGSRKIEDYLENKQDDQTQKERIYGIDPGMIENVESINQLSEVDLYFHIDAMGSYIWNCRHAMAHDRLPIMDLNEAQYALEYMVYQTTKFGVELPKPEVGKHIETTPSYQAWYGFYANHFKNVLTDEQWNAFKDAKRNGQDTSAYMPKGSWTNLLENSDKPSTRVLK